MRVPQTRLSGVSCTRGYPVELRVPPPRFRYSVAAQRFPPVLSSACAADPGQKLYRKLISQRISISIADAARSVPFLNVTSNAATLNIVTAFSPGVGCCVIGSRRAGLRVAHLSLRANNLAATKRGGEPLHTLAGQRRFSVTKNRPELMFGATNLYQLCALW